MTILARQNSSPAEAGFTTMNPDDKKVHKYSQYVVTKVDVNIRGLHSQFFSEVPIKSE